MTIWLEFIVVFSITSIVSAFTLWLGTFEFGRGLVLATWFITNFIVSIFVTAILDDNIR